jgi:hypothetical protein
LAPLSPGYNDAGHCVLPSVRTVCLYGQKPVISWPSGCSACTPCGIDIAMLWSVLWISFKDHLGQENNSPHKPHVCLTRPELVWPSHSPQAPYLHVTSHSRFTGDASLVKLLLASGKSSRAIPDTAGGTPSILPLSSCQLICEREHISISLTHLQALSPTVLVPLSTPYGLLDSSHCHCHHV